jgi:hypothetical protein
VKISIALAPLTASDEEGLLSSLWDAGSSDPTGGATWYRLVVRLPAATGAAADPALEEGALMEDAAMEGEAL